MTPSPTALQEHRDLESTKWVHTGWDPVYESRLKALAMRKMGDSGSWTLENCPLARRAWSLYQGIHMRRDPLARLGGTGRGAGREESGRGHSQRRQALCLHGSAKHAENPHTGCGAGEGRNRRPEDFL